MLDEVVGAGELAVIVDVEDERAAGGVGGVDGGEDAVVQQRTGDSSPLASAVDARRSGRGC